MLKLNVNQEKQLNFEIQIGGVQSDQVSSFLRIEIDHIEYGFPAKVGQESITVDLPALRNVVGGKLKEGDEVKVKLEIVADGHYLTPWNDTFSLSNPLMVEAKIVDEDFKSPPTVKTTLITKGKSGDETQGVVVEHKEVTQTEEELTEKIVNKLAERLSPMFKAKAKKAKAKTITEEKVIEKTPVVEEVVEQPKKVSKIDVKNITEDEVYNYMKRAGTTNPTVQKLIYEQAEIAASSSKPVNVLRHVVKLLKK